MNSFNHYALGAVGEWLFEYALGIKCRDDGVVVSPSVDFSGKINCVKGSTETLYGRVSVAWEVKEGIAYLKIDAPEECRVILPDDGRTYLVKTPDSE